MTIPSPIAASVPGGAPKQSEARSNAPTAEAEQTLLAAGTAGSEGTPEGSFASSFFNLTDAVEDPELDISLETAVDVSAPSEPVLAGGIAAVAQTQAASETQSAPAQAKSSLPSTNEAKQLPLISSQPVGPTQESANLAERSPALPSSVSAPIAVAPSAQTSAPVAAIASQTVRAVATDQRLSSSNIPQADATLSGRREPTQPQTQTIKPPTPVLASEPVTTRPVAAAAEPSLSGLLSSSDLPSLQLNDAVGSSASESISRSRDPGLLDAPPARQERALSQTISNQISQAIRGNDAGRFEVTLDPPELGRVTVTLVTTGDSVSAQIASERPEIGDMLRRHNDLLHRELSNAGFKNVSLDFGFQRQQGEQRSLPPQVSQQSESFEPAASADLERTTSQITNAGLDLRI